MKEYRVKKGNHRFVSTKFPYLPPCPKFYKDLQGKVFWVEVIFGESALHEMPLEDGTQDKDIKDWNFKIAPHSFHPIFNDRDSIMLAARSNPEEQVIELTCYSNAWIGNKFSYRAGAIGEREEVMATARPGDRVRWEATVDESGELWRMRVGQKSGDLFSYAETVHPMRDKFKWIKVASSWFGGANNSYGKWGGVAPQDTRISYTFGVDNI